MISIIVPCARPERASMTLAALERQALQGAGAELLVVTPRPQAVPQPSGPSVRVIAVEKLFPPGRMRNIGASQARGDILMFMDDDCVPPPEWAATLVRELDLDDRLGMVGCRLVSLDKGFWARCADLALFAAYQHSGKQMTDLGSAAIAVRRKAFDSVAGFDEELLASEDWDFSLRLRAQGWECLFTPEATVLHDHGRSSPDAILRQSWRSGFLSGLVVQERHPALLTWLARLSLRCKAPWKYALLLGPYALLVTVFQGWGWVRDKPSDLIHLPLVFVARLTYHLGVLARLRRDHCANVTRQ